MGGKWCKKNTESESLFFSPFTPPPMLGTLFIVRALKLASPLSLSLHEIFQDQGSGYLLRVSSGSLYGVSLVKIPSKCWGWSNLMFTLNLLMFLDIEVLWNQLKKFSFDKTGLIILMYLATNYFFIAKKTIKTWVYPTSLEYSVNQISLPTKNLSPYFYSQFCLNLCFLCQLRNLLMSRSTDNNLNIEKG